MSKRINVILPDATVALLNRAVSKGNRSRLNLRERLKQGALANAGLNLEIAQEWFPAENEPWRRLEREEKAAAKATRSAGKSTSRRSTRR